MAFRALRRRNWLRDAAGLWTCIVKLLRSTRFVRPNANCIGQSVDLPNDHPGLTDPGL